MLNFKKCLINNVSDVVRTLIDEKKINFQNIQYLLMITHNRKKSFNGHNNISLIVLSICSSNK